MGATTKPMNPAPEWKYHISWKYHQHETWSWWRRSWVATTQSGRKGWESMGRTIGRRESWEMEMGLIKGLLVGKSTEVNGGGRTRERKLGVRRKNLYSKISTGLRRVKTRMQTHHTGSQYLLVSTPTPP